MYMNYIKLFAKNKKELENLIQAIRIYGQNTRMKFGIEKCVMIITKIERIETTKDIELPNQESIRTFGEKKNYVQEYLKRTPINKLRWKK